MKVEIDLPEPPEGYEYTGEYRAPNKNDTFLDLDGLPFDLNGDGDYLHEGDNYPILRKLKPPREFKDKAHYPFYFSGHECTGQYEAKLNRLGGLRVEDPCMSWIGEELEIKWGE